MQNCFVENLKSIIFLTKNVNSSLVICDTIFFADRTIRYSIFKHNAQNISNRAATASKHVTAAGVQINSGRLAFPTCRKSSA
jgi:hypothetical protein